MKRMILSRKGTDISYGGLPSLIYDNKLLTFPIPSKVQSGIDWELLQWENEASNITNYFIKETNHGVQYHNARLHLDPDIRESALKNRDPEWRGLFGQCDIAQRHLLKEGVKENDLFLFFGWYKEAVKDGDKWKLVGKDKHVLWGWLQIDQILKINEETIEKNAWMAYHPHLQNDFKEKFRNKENTLYIAKKNLDIGIPELARTPGFGTFKKFDPKLVLTRGEETRSKWSLPNWMLLQDEMDSSKGRVHMSYHLKKRVSYHENEKFDFDSAWRGQEFVLDCEEYDAKGKDYKKWLRDIFSLAAN